MRKMLCVAILTCTAMTAARTAFASGPNDPLPVPPIIWGPSPVPGPDTSGPVDPTPTNPPNAQ